MRHKLSHLPNKLPFLTVPIPNTDSVTLTIWANVGSRNETGKVAGISHFLEHMVFKGTTKRPTPKIIAEEIDSFGGEFNAGTSKEWTNFYIKAPVKRLETAFDVLSDMVLDPLIDKEALGREKGVIVEEIGMYEDTPSAHIGDLFERLIFAKSVLGRDIIGTRETVRGVKRGDFTKYRNKHYFAKNFLVTVSGGVGQKKVNGLVQKYFSGLKSGTKRKDPKLKIVQTKPQLSVTYKKSEQAHLILGFLGTPRGHKDRFIESVLTTILGQGMSSRLFTEVREKRGLAYAVRSSATGYQDTGYVDTYAGVDPKRATEAVKVILDQHMGLANGEYKITDKELKKAKEYIKGHLALGLENTKAINSFFGVQQLKRGKIDTPDFIYKSIDKVSISQVLQVAKKLYTKENLNLAVIGPFKNKSAFQTIIN
ncbi:M16 family metallopeptidase [Patescibacteria group bacterium]